MAWMLKKLFIVVLVVCFQASSLGQTFQFAFSSQVHAQSAAQPVNLVAIFVDQSIYTSIQSDLQRYTTTYIPAQAPGTKTLVFPINSSTFKARDLQKIIENLYYDGQQDEASQLVWVILFGELPMPIVELEGRRFVSMYPYVDIEEPMFLYDKVSDIFVYNDNPNSLPELRHSTIPSNDAGLISTFFTKLKAYFANPTAYAKPKIRYDDIQFLEESYTDQELDRYLNTLMFAEYDSYRNDTGVFSRLMNKDYETDLVDAVEEGKEVIEKYQAEAVSHESVVGQGETEQAASEIGAGVNTILERLDPEALKKTLVDSGEKPITTLVLEKEMLADFQPNYTMFGNDYLSALQENVLAGGRYQLEDVDTSLEKMEIRDRVSKQFIKDMNTVMEDAVYKQIDVKDYPLKYPLPFRYSKRIPRYENYGSSDCCGVFREVPYTLDFFNKVFTWPKREALKSLFAGKILLQGDFMGLAFGGRSEFILGWLFQQSWKECFERARYENHYFWENAVDVTGYQDLTIYRGDYFNIETEEELRALALKVREDAIEDLPGRSFDEMSMGAWMGVISMQTEANKAFNYDRILNTRRNNTNYDFYRSDKELYDIYKCDEEQELDDFSFDFRGGASPMNIDFEQFASVPKWPITKPSLTDRELAWHPTSDRRIWEWRYDPAWNRLVIEEVPEEDIHKEAHRLFGSVIAVWNEDKRDRLIRARKNEKRIGQYRSILDGKVNRCEERDTLDDFPERETSFDEVDYFRVYDNRFPWPTEWIGITVQPNLRHDEDQDTDTVPRILDGDMDGDRIPNGADPDMDGDRHPNNEDDNDMDGDGFEDYEDGNVDDDHDILLPNPIDPDIDGDGKPNGQDKNADGDALDNGQRLETDIDGDGIKNGVDPDMDYDGLKNDDPAEDDIDGDEIPDGLDSDPDSDNIPNKFDKDCNGNGTCNGADRDVDGDNKQNDDDIDGDGIPNATDEDVDGDDIPNGEDGDIDGDGIINPNDPDMDGDGIPNGQDEDTDGDRMRNHLDEEPNGRWSIASSWVEVQLMEENCMGAPDDVDNDWTKNGSDLDIDDDGRHNVDDADMDGDGIPNKTDLDMDCDGMLNEVDDDIDCDGSPNGADGDCDGDGTPNEADDDIDGDWLDNGDAKETDIDGDGIPDGADTDSDGDGIPNTTDDDMDGDGIPNGEDYEDLDGDGIPNEEDDDMDGDGVPNDQDYDMDGDTLPNDADGDCNCNGKSDAEDPDDDSDGIPDDQDKSPLWFHPRAKRAKTEDRGDNTCFLTWHDYRYQIIETIIDHRNPIAWDLDEEMNILTMERPIDDGRYVAFHGLGGDVVKFMYPDLYNVPIYDCNLLDPEDIEEHIKKYLRDKIQVYNQYLEEQLNKAPAWYARHPAAYDFLETVDRTATPKRTYELFYEDFLVDAVGEKNIRRLSEHLHYLSKGWEQRPSAGTIGEFIEKSKEQFNYNDKLEYVIDEYLKYDTEDFKFDPIAFPTHIEKGYAYEVGYINSDGVDVVQPHEPFNDDRENQVPEVLTTENTTPAEVGNTATTGAVKAMTAGEQDDAECGVPAGKAVPLLKWPQAFTCWLTNTIKKPVTFSVEVEIDYDEAYDEKFKERQDNRKAGAFSSVIKLSDRNVISRPTPLKSALWKYTSENDDPEGMFAAVYAQELEAQEFNEMQRTALDEEEKPVFTSLQYDIGVWLKYESYDADSARLGTLSLQSRKDIGTVRFTIRSVGDICPVISGRRLCVSELGLVFNPYTQKQSLPVTFSDAIAGVGILMIEACDETGSICARHDVSLTRSPGILERLSITVPTDTIVAGSTLPFQIEGFDAADNRITYSPVPFEVQLEGASFDDAGTVTSQIITNFQDAAYLLYTRSEDINKEVIIRVAQQTQTSWSGESSATGFLFEHRISLQGGVWEATTINGAEMQEISYRLPKKSVWFTSVDSNGIVQARVDQYPSFTVRIRWSNNELLYAPISIAASRGYVRLWKLSERQVEINNTTVAQRFFSDATTFMPDESGSVTVSLLPVGKSGKDTLVISSPGMDDLQIPVEILAAGPEVLDVALHTKWVRANEEFKGQVTIRDSRWNPYTEATTVELQPWGDLEVDDTTIVVSWGTAEFGCRGGGWSCGMRARTIDGAPSENWENGDQNDGDSENNDDRDDTTDWEADENGDANDEGDENDADGDESDNGDKEESEDAEDGTDQWNGEACTPQEKNYAPDPKWYQSDLLYSETHATLPDVVWPDAPADDINVMYLNLFGHPWGNYGSTVELLGNTKTLAVSTYQSFEWTAEEQRVVAALLHPDGRVKDELGIVKELVAEGWDIIMLLWNQGGIGRVRVWSHTEFEMVHAGSEYNQPNKLNKLVYTPWNSDSITEETDFSQARIRHNGEIVVDFIRGYMDPLISIRLPNGGNERSVLYNNKEIGKLLVHRGEPGLAQDLHLYRNDYVVDDMPFGSSTNSDSALAIILESNEGAEGDIDLFESIEAGFVPKKLVGFRHTFNNISNFAQGMLVWPATKPYGGPFLINFWDPFLERVKQNRSVFFTPYDEGAGKVIFSDTESMQDVDPIDFDKDGKKDIVVSYKDGAIRILKNYGGAEPYHDLWMLIVVADGIKETFVGDVDGNGYEDLLISTKADKLRAYLNTNGQFEVDGQIVCLDIPNGEFNVAQVRQLFAEDMDADGALDIITNDINGDIKVFYGGSSGGKPNYVSTNPLRCDDDRKERLNVQLVKSFTTTLTSSPIKDTSLRYRPWLQVAQPDAAAAAEEEAQADDTDAWNSGGGGPNFKKMKKDEIKRYAESVTAQAIDQADQNADPWKLMAEAGNHINYVMAVPDMMRPIALQGDETMGVVRAIDDVSVTPRFEATKVYTDLDGGKLLKGDLVRITVSLTPVWGTVWPIVYREQLYGPWILYKDEFNKLPSFDDGGLWSAYEIDWNIGQGYEFMIYNLTLDGTKTFSYEVQYDGDGYMNIDVETLKKEMFKWPTNHVADLFSQQAYAQGGREKRIRAYPDDGCYKEYYLYSPAEQKVPLDPFLKSKTAEYNSNTAKNRDNAEKITKANTSLEPIEKLMGIPETLTNSILDKRKRAKVAMVVGGGGWTDLQLDAVPYLDWFVDDKELQIEKEYKEKAQDLMEFATLWLFPDDYEFSYEKCQGVTFGKKLCGSGRPIPFNTDLLSPGMFQIMGCAPKTPNIPWIFPDFDGVPIFAFPTNGIIPVRPPTPFWAGGIPPFKGKTSQFRTYLTRTTSNGLWLSLCFGPYGVTDSLPTPLGDVGGNCLVIAGNLGPQCTGVGPTTTDPSPKKQSTPSQTESTYTVLPQQYDLHQVGACDAKARAAQATYSPELGWQVALLDRPTAMQATVLQADYDYLKGWRPFNLKIEGGDVKGLVQCIVRKRVENQTRYFANNALNMQITLVLPSLDELAENMEDVKDVDRRQAFMYDRENRRTSFEKTANPGTEEKRTDEKNRNTKVFMPKSVLVATSEMMNNPFDVVAARFDHVPLINFEERTVSVEVPWLYKEDIDRYEFYLSWWDSRNTRILEERKTNQLVDADTIAEMEQALTNVRRNLDTIKKYRELPSQIYAMLHASDQYITEVFYFAESFVSQITGWMQDNATRFSLRVDFVILLIGIVETWQLLIDFSVERQSRCAKCKQDHYDYYSCKLKLLCVDLPILPLPPFHLPDIFIDLSKISVGIDFIVPKFNFVPRKLTLPQIPDLPYPRTIDVTVNIPTIPLLPPPPPLPDMPELDLEVDIELPTLPPAPKIPKISPVIKSVLKLLDVLGAFMCIFKGGIGLVSEENIKARVEQLTQRKMDLQPFDSLKITIPQSPIESYDYRVDSRVDIKADFSALYDVVDGIATRRNQGVDNSFKHRRTQYDQIKGDIGQGLGEAAEDLGIPADGIDDDIIIELGDANVDEETMVTLLAEQRKNRFMGGEPSEVRAQLRNDMDYVLSRQDLSPYHPRAQKVLDIVDTDATVQPNIKWVQEMGRQATEYVAEQAEQIKSLKDLVYTDYDAFLDTVVGVSKNVANDASSVSFGSTVFETSPQVLALLETQQHPLTSYLEMNETFVDGFADALQNNSPLSLNMSPLHHTSLLSYFENLKGGIATTKQLLAQNEGVTTAISPSEDVPEKKPLIAQAGWAAGNGDADSLLNVDFTQFLEWFFVPGADENYHNVVARKEKGNKRNKENTYHVQDMNGDGELDILLYDVNQIFIKYGKQNASYGGAGYTKYYQIGPFASPEALAQAVEPTYGRYTMGGEKFKIRDKEYVMEEYMRFGHNFDSMSFMRDNDPRVAWYLIQVAERVTVHHNKERGGPKENDPQRTQYVLALPKSLTTTGIAVEIFDQLDAKPIPTYLKNGTLLDVTYYDGNSTHIDSILLNVPKKRYYTKVAPLYLEKDESGAWFRDGLFGGDEAERVLRRMGPWSRQEVGGAQNRADDEIPQVKIKLIRNLTNQVIAQGSFLQGNINTTYTIEAEWTDNGEVLKNRIKYKGEVIALEEGAVNVLENLDFKQPIEEEFVFAAIDQAWNIWEQIVKLHIIVPELTIEEIRYLQGGAEIETRLSDTIDRGQIKFRKNRQGITRALQPHAFPTKPLDPVVIGGLYPFDDGITLHDGNGNPIGEVDTDDGVVKILPIEENENNEGGNTWWWEEWWNNAWWNSGGWWDWQRDGAWQEEWTENGTGSSEGDNDEQKKFQIRVVFDADGRPVVNIINKDPQTWAETVVFSIYYKAQALVNPNGLEVVQWTYERLSLETEYLWAFNNGRCIRPIGEECHMYISPTWSLIVPPPYNQQYTAEYATYQNYVQFTLYDMKGVAVIRLRFIPEPIE